MAENTGKSRRGQNAKKSLASRIFASNELSGIGSAGTMRLLKGRFSKIVNYCGRSVAYTSVRSYGFFALAFGLMTLFLNLGEYYFEESPSITISSLIIGAALTVLGIPLLFFDKPMCIALQDMAITDFVFFEFFSIKRMHRINDSSTPVPPIYAIFLGFIPAVIGFFVPLDIVVAVIALSLVTTVAFISPEFPMILSLLVLPYTLFIPNSSLILAVLSAVSFLSFGRKVILGKRVYNFQTYDVLILFISVMLLISGLVVPGKDAFLDSLILVCIIHGYFPAANLIVNRRLTDCAVNALTVSSVPVCILAIIEFFVELPGGAEAAVGSTPGISVMFENQAALVSFLLVCGVFVLGFATEKSSTARKALVCSAFVLILVTLSLTLDPFAFVTVVFAVFAYALVTVKKLPADVVLILVVLAHLIFALPTSFLDTVSAFFGMERTFSEIFLDVSAGLDAFLSNVFFGVGVGNSVGENTNLLTGISMGCGVFVLFGFVLLILLRMRHISHYRHFVRSSLVKIPVRTSLLAIVCVLIYGSFFNAFSEAAVIYVFSVTFGIGTATLNIAKREHDNRMGYYGDLSSIDSAALDVVLK